MTSHYSKHNAHIANAINSKKHRVLVENFQKIVNVRFFYILRSKNVVVLLTLIFFLQNLLSQTFTTRENINGYWASSASWNPDWINPAVNDITQDIIINGNIRRNGNLSFNGGSLYINDTLIIEGNLTMGLNNSIVVNSNGILIVYGNIQISDSKQTVNTYSDAYFIVTGNYIFLGEDTTGSFTSTDAPAKVFIAGNISPQKVTDSLPNYSTLNCTSPSNPYVNSTCNYGNIDDLKEDPLYDYFQSTQNAPPPPPVINMHPIDQSCCISANASFSVIASNVDAYQWMVNNGSGYKNIVNGTDYSGALTNQLTINNPKLAQNDYLFYCSIRGQDGTTVVSSEAMLSVSDMPMTNAGADSTTCKTSFNLDATLNSGTGIWTKTFGPGTASFSPTISNPKATVSVTIPGTYTFAWIGTNNICTDTSTVNITFTKLPKAFAGPNQELHASYETTMQASLEDGETGEWKILNGQASIEDINSPSSKVTNLEKGGNIFQWVINKGICQASDELSIIVNELVVPNTITPNGDSKNDYFFLNGIENIGPVKLIIMDRWGKEVYYTEDYQNEWNGNNKDGKKLPDDTYYTFIEFGNKEAIRGYVLIKR